MKFSLRRETGDGPTAAFAGILDGRFLWVAVDAAPGSLALREASGQVLPLPTDVTEDQPAYLSARIDLDGLPGTGTYDVVLVPEGGGAATPVMAEPLVGDKPQPAADGRTQHALQRGDDGALQVRRTTLPEAATLTAVTVEPARGAAHDPWPRHHGRAGRGRRRSDGELRHRARRRSPHRHDHHRRRSTPPRRR